MNTFFKSLIAGTKRCITRLSGEGTWFFIFITILTVIGAVQTDRAISKGMNATLTIAGFFTFTATASTGLGAGDKGLVSASSQAN